MESTGTNVKRPATIQGPLTVTVSNIGGISEGTIEFAPGVTIIAGANASNKSSLLQGVNAVIGGPEPSLKSDVNHGTVHLAVDGGEEYSIDIARQDGRPVVTEANRFCAARDRCELFVSLDESNPIRQAVVGGGDLHDLLMRPVDTDAIEAEIARLERRKESLTDELTTLDRLEDTYPSLELRSRSLREELTGVERALTDKRDAIEAAETSQVASEEAQHVLEELRTVRSEREAIHERLQTQTDVIDSLREERRAVREQIEEFDDSGVHAGLETIEHELDQLRQEKQTLTNTITALSPLVEMNRQLLVDDGELAGPAMGETVLDQLDPASRTMTCWTCGSAVERSQIAEQVAVIGEILTEKREQRRAIEAQIEAHTEQKRRIEHSEHELNELNEREQDLEAELETRERTLSELQAELGNVDETIAALQSTAETTEELRDSAIVDLHQEASHLEYRRGQLESKLEAVHEDRADIEAALDRRDDLITERSSVRERLQNQRDRITTIERETVATFNECMQEVLDRLDYENIERVWIERIARDGAATDTTFELHVVRTSENGAAYEDVISTLSKSEREVVGLVVALAGYIVYDVADEVPLVVIDAIEMLDANRIQALLEFFGQHARYVLAATLPEEARKLKDAYACLEVNDLVLS